MSRKAKQSKLRRHLEHPLPGVRVMRGPNKKRQIVLGRPGLLAKTIGGEPREAEKLRAEQPTAEAEATTTALETVDQIWLAGLDAFEEGDAVAAGDHWARALILDPTCADAMLGLHALDPSRDELLRRMYENIESFGELRDRHERRLASTYRPTGFMIEHLELADDLRRALAIFEHRSENAEQANSLLEDARPCTLTSAVWARIAFENDDFQRCLAICQKLERDDELAADIDLMTGGSLLALDLAEPALEVLQRAVLGAPELEAELQARYYLGLAFEKLGRDNEARQQFEAVYAADMNFADAGQRLGLGGDEAEPLGAPELEPEWQELVASLKSGELATDPSIPDNQG